MTIMDSPPEGEKRCLVCGTKMFLYLTKTGLVWQCAKDITHS